MDRDGVTLARDMLPESEELGPNEAILYWSNITCPASDHFQSARQKFYEVMAKHEGSEVWGELMAVIAKESEGLVAFAEEISKSEKRKRDQTEGLPGGLVN